MSQPVSQLVQLSEVTYGTDKLSIDREAGIIRGVKILGLKSSNGYGYSPAALAEAMRLYEGRPVNINHSAKPTDPRSAYDRFGQLANVEVRADGLYGNLHYLKTHSMAGPLTEAAERMPTVFGLSHNAQGRQRRKDKMVEAILSVASVDIVGDPATTNGLFEERRMTAKQQQTVKAWLAEHFKGDAAKLRIVE